MNSLKNEFYKDIEVKNRSKNTLITLRSALEDCEKAINKPLELAEWEDIRGHIAYLQKVEYSRSTIALRKTKLKQFFSYCYESTDDKKYKKMIKELSCKITGDKKLSADDILTDSDTQKMVNVSTLERDRCILKTLFESGMRIGELLALTWDMVQINHEQREVTFNIPDIEGCKTGARVVMCTDIYYYVCDWKKCSTSPKFMDISMQGLNDKLKAIAKRAGINKAVNPHAFRHAAITHEVIRGKLNEFQLKMRFWGSLNTNMLAVYVHLSETMKQDAYRTSKGKDNKDSLKPVDTVCLECGRPVKDGMSLCKQCNDMKKLSTENSALKSELDKFKMSIEVLCQQINKLSPKE